MPSNGMSRWRRIALPVSIVLNLFLIAMIGGHVLRLRSYELNTGTLWARALARAEARLPRKDAAAFSAVIRRDAPNYAEAQQRIVEARQELRRRIAAEPFDQQAVREALATWRAAWNAFFDRFGNTLVDAVAQVSPEGRRKLVAEPRWGPATAP